MSNQATWTPSTPHPLITPVPNTPVGDNLSVCGYTPEYILVVPGARLQLRYGKITDVFAPLETPTTLVWNNHGDHPFVEHYGLSLLDQYPNYASCGVVRLTPCQYAHVAPGSTLHIQNGFIFKVSPPAHTA